MLCVSAAVHAKSAGPSSQTSNIEQQAFKENDSVSLESKCRYFHVINDELKLCLPCHYCAFMHQIHVIFCDSDLLLIC